MIYVVIGWLIEDQDVMEAHSTEREADRRAALFNQAPRQCPTWDEEHGGCDHNDHTIVSVRWLS